jgi:hypothetical protein
VEAMRCRGSGLGAALQAVALHEPEDVRSFLADVAGQILGQKFSPLKLAEKRQSITKALCIHYSK